MEVNLPWLQDCGEETSCVGDHSNAKLLQDPEASRTSNSSRKDGRGKHKRPQVLIEALKNRRSGVYSISGKSPFNIYPGVVSRRAHTDQMLETVI